MRFYNDKLKYYRKINNFTINKLAMYIDKSRKTISSWEHGRTKPTKSDIIAISSILNIDPNDISDIDEIKHSLNNKIVNSNDDLISENQKLKSHLIRSLKASSRLERNNGRLNIVHRQLYLPTNDNYSKVISHFFFFLKNFISVLIESLLEKRKVYSKSKLQISYNCR